jgi:hypothetical protein
MSKAKDFYNFINGDSAIAKSIFDVILPVMTDAKISRTAKRKTLSDAVEQMPEKVFANNLIANQVMTIINMKEDVCKEYPNAEAQVNGILSWIPKMELHRKMLEKQVIKNRKKYGLKI